MIFIENNLTNDPAFNLAVEETLLRQKNDHESYLLLYINAPSVVIGRHQNIYEEVDLKRCQELNIPILRRISGGGAVYHDQGNLNFSLITDYSPKLFNSYEPFLKLIITALNEMGIPAEQNEHNDIILQGNKISGTAQFTIKDRMLTHGTLLYNADIKLAEMLLSPSNESYKSKSKKSYPSPISNIYDFLEDPVDISLFKKNLMDILFKNMGHKQKVINEEIIKDAKILANKRFNSWEWNYGRSPACEFMREIRQYDGYLKLWLYIKKGIIKKVKIDSDFIPNDKKVRIENLFLEQKNDILSLKLILKKIEKLGIKPIDWLSLIFGK